VTAPIPVRVLRHACPHCRRTHSRPGRAREHMARCWHNPDAKGCKTCKHFETYGGEYGDHCGIGVSLKGRPACKPCGGRGETFDLGDLGASECYECGGDGAEIKAGPIVGCDRWEASDDCATNSICPARAECEAANACRITRARRPADPARLAESKETP
jgi:hypothetical protein